MRREIDGWVEVWQSGIDYEADLVRDRLDDAGIEAVIMKKKDRSFSLTHGSMSRILVMVPAEREQEALELLGSAVPSEDELTQAALAADPVDVQPPSSPETELGSLDESGEHPEGESLR